MENDIRTLFQNKKANEEKLLSFGFMPAGEGYIYRETFPGTGFQMTVTVSGGGVTSQVTDPVTEEPYVLHLVEGAAGSFVGEIRAQYEAVLLKISDACFDADVFRFEMTNRLIAYAKEQYGDEPEFLWGKYPDAAVLRRKDSMKWYGLLMTLSKRKLGLPSDDMAEILDLRIPEGESTDLLDGVRYFPGYHMNKKHWYTMILDGSVPFREICLRVDGSYRKAAK